MFDVKKAIKSSGLSKSEIVQLEKEIKKDYPRDQMLYELHMIRALKTRFAKPIRGKSGRDIRELRGKVAFSKPHNYKDLRDG